MDMCYDGTLVMPSSYALMDEEEMMYVEGGGTETYTGTAKKLKGTAASLLAAWTSLATGYTTTSAVAAATGAGIPIAAISGLGTAYCWFAANEYRGAYTYFSALSQTSSKKYKMTTVTLGVLITGVVYGKA